MEARNRVSSGASDRHTAQAQPITVDPDDPALQAHMKALLTPSEEVTALALDPTHWEVVTQEIRTREATGPDGAETATVKDGVVLLRRR